MRANSPTGPASRSANACATSATWRARLTVTSAGPTAEQADHGGQSADRRPPHGVRDPCTGPAQEVGLPGDPPGRADQRDSSGPDERGQEPGARPGARRQPAPGPSRPRRRPAWRRRRSRPPHRGVGEDSSRAAHRPPRRLSRSPSSSAPSGSRVRGRPPISSGTWWAAEPDVPGCPPGGGRLALRVRRDRPGQHHQAGHQGDAHEQGPESRGHARDHRSPRRPAHVRSGRRARRARAHSPRDSPPGRGPPRGARSVSCPPFRLRRRRLRGVEVSARGPRASAGRSPRASCRP